MKAFPYHIAGVAKVHSKSRPSLLLNPEDGALIQLLFFGGVGDSIGWRIPLLVTFVSEDQVKDPLTHPYLCMADRAGVNKKPSAW